MVFDVIIIRKSIDFRDLVGVRPDGAFAFAIRAMIVRLTRSRKKRFGWVGVQWRLESRSCALIGRIRKSPETCCLSQQ
jgi:hypothetical protein